MNYRDLDVWQLARESVIGIHHMTSTKLPKFEMFEEGSQIRRAIKSVKSNIVEGYGRRCYKQEFVRFIVYALAFCDETADYLETLASTKSLRDAATIEELGRRLDQLGRKLNLFLQSIERSHQSQK
ncbi:MAG: four helix bundle protein [Verrucomicrobia bacterium]|nr:MAG: four helix bundle protein [Verrucomicrobiota bacterium]